MSNAPRLFEIESHPDYVLVRFFEFIDASTVDQARPVLDKSIPTPCPHIIIDMSKVDFLDSHGVGLFVSLLKKVHHDKKKLVFTGTEGQPASVLDMVGLNQSLVTYSKNISEAQKALSA